MTTAEWGYLATSGKMRVPQRAFDARRLSKEGVLLLAAFAAQNVPKLAAFGGEVEVLMAKTPQKIDRS